MTKSELFDFLRDNLGVNLWVKDYPDSKRIHIQLILQNPSAPEELVVISETDAFYVPQCPV